jgi:hypothetical protein
VREKAEPLRKGMPILEVPPRAYGKIQRDERRTKRLEHAIE